jgi:hypothetical protein
MIMRNLKSLLLAAVIAGSFVAASDMKADARVFVGGGRFYGHRYYGRTFVGAPIYATPGWGWGYGGWGGWRGNRFYGGGFRGGHRFFRR